MRIALHGKIFDQQAKPDIRKVVSLLEENDVDIVITRTFSKILCEAFEEYKKYPTLKVLRDSDQIDYLISLGGDGTLLEAVAMVGSLEIPILGINTGRLGFLATTSKNSIDQAIAGLLNNDFTIDNRTLIRLESDKDLFKGKLFALNEFTILKTDSSSMITVHTYLDGEYLNSYWSDGLIVSTPTGSTGYSLSCGGPIVAPHSKNFIITPVSPHNLNVRPLIVSDKSKISFKIEGRSNKFLVSLDSKSESVESSTKLTVRKEDFNAKLITFNHIKYFDTLRQKLNWGLDLRN